MCPSPNRRQKAFLKAERHSPNEEINAYHKTRYTYNPGRSGVWREVCRYLRPYLPERATVLDLGAGYGDFLRYIVADKKYALDINPALVSSELLT